MSPTDPTLLLKQLEPAVRPAYAAAPVARPQAPLEQTRFEELLAQASRGLVKSDRSVVHSMPVAPTLDQPQMARLASAADLAEASGARRALMLIDGRGLILDVSSRALTAELSSASALVDTDAAVYVAGGDDEPDAARLPLPGGIAPRAVAEQIDAACRGRAPAHAPAPDQSRAG
ncbi:MAG: hypothetical protein ACYS0G_12065 [Planctomycetota bacterium]|jgi:hypothetical protein